MTDGLPRSVRVFAPAKVNPTLAVLGRRDDGYHEVRTTLVMLDVGDVVTLRLRPAEDGPGRVQVHGPAATADIPSDGSNLAVRALEQALQLLEVAGHGVVDLEVEKHVPSQAGLGGGSSDAAAVLRGVEALTGQRVGDSERLALLAGLGADCVFFDAAVRTGAGLASGFGEQLVALPAPDWHVAVLTPEAVCPTGAIYGALDLRRLDPSRGDDDPLRYDVPTARERLFNDLESAALRAVPELRPWRGLLDRLGAHDPRFAAFRLSGSGSSWFGLAASAAEASELLAALVAAAELEGLAHRASFTARVAAPPLDR